MTSKKSILLMAKARTASAASPQNLTKYIVFYRPPKNTGGGKRSASGYLVWEGVIFVLFGINITSALFCLKISNQLEVIGNDFAKYVNFDNYDNELNPSF